MELDYHSYLKLILPAQHYETTTVKVTSAPVTPDRLAVILVVPAATAVARLAADMVAVAFADLAQATWEVMFAVELSEYVPAAVNCWVEPTAEFAGLAGITRRWRRSSSAMSERTLR